MRTRHELIAGRNGYEKWLPTLETGSREVFRMMLGTELGRGSPEPWKGAEFTAMVGLAGNLCGLLSVRCREESATLIASAMLDLAPNNVADHACDAIGEVANMIAGNFKNKLQGRDFRCRLQFSITHRHRTTRPVVHLPWTSAGSYFGNSQLERHCGLKILDCRLNCIARKRP